MNTCNKEQEERAVVLRAEHISHDFEGKSIIENISMTVKKGEIIGLLGVSGVGKTTLFHILSGILKPTKGMVFLDEDEITGKAGKISYMLQKDLLLPYKTIEDNVSLPLQLQGVKRKAAWAQVSCFFEKFGLMGVEKKYPHQLSGGMRQRAALLRTYMFSQKVALLDEPFSALDAITKSTMQQWYLSVMEEINMSTIFITHDIDESIILSDRIYIMTGVPGKITHEIVIQQPKPRSTQFQVTQEFIEYKKQILEILNSNKN